MKASTSRILTTHAGSLPRPEALNALLIRRSRGEAIDAGLRVAHLGRTSVRYEIGLFRQGDDQPAALGYFVHVFVERASRKPTPIPQTVREALARLHHPSA